MGAFSLRVHDVRETAGGTMLENSTDVGSFYTYYKFTYYRQVQNVLKLAHKTRTFIALAYIYSILWTNIPC
jgi:hypothetical protein